MVLCQRGGGWEVRGGADLSPSRCGVLLMLMLLAGAGGGAGGGAGRGGGAGAAADGECPLRGAGDWIGLGRGWLHVG